MPRTDGRRYGSRLAVILARMERGIADGEDAVQLRRELEVFKGHLARERDDRQRRVRAGLGLARGTLDNLLAHNARPVHGGALLLIDGGRRA